MGHRFRFAIVLVLAAQGCAPRLSPLPGTAVPARALPPAQLKAGHQRVVFRWELEDQDMAARGEGAARIASPDSARLDFFLGGGFGSGAAVLIGDQLRVPSGADDVSRRFVPPPPMLWGALGRLALPVTRDTVVRVDGDTLRADIGTPVAWRVTFVRDTLRRIERVEGGRVAEWVHRYTDGRLRYRHEVSRRQLDLFVTRTDPVSGFDSDVWVLP
ncbi:MAG TPA: hypothetical protein VFO66_05280 [Gemmatimonadaceae bacterium]|nr:hypothetical protein [Gemmatimonadaceae bacterium]